MATSDDVLQQIIRAFTDGEFDEINSLVQQGLDACLDPDGILGNGLILGIREVGEQFRRSEVYLPEMMMAADAWQEGMELLEPLISER